MASLLAGCVSYRPSPLATSPTTRNTASALKVDVGTLRVVPLKPISVDVSDGLDPIEVAVLAVLNSPALDAKRAALKVNAAQIFAAGLLPDPGLGLSVGRPIAGPDTETSYGVTPSLDLAGMIGRAQSRSAARFSAKQADLDLLWAEWDTAQQARQLAENVLASEARAAALRPLAALAADRYDRTGRAFERRDATAQTTAADLAYKIDTQSQLAAAERDAASARRALNALLNLDVAVRLPLILGREPSAIGVAAIESARASLPSRRPDLLALQAGYSAQDALLRRAILAQFPISQIAGALARDTGGVLSLGAAATVVLPIFNGQRGGVRIQEASREQLRAEYAARLSQTDVEVAAATAELQLAHNQLQRLTADVPRLEALVRPAAAAYGRGDLDSLTFLTLSQNALTKRLDLDAAQLSARLAQIRLETALFLPPAAFRLSQ